MSIKNAVAIFFDLPKNTVAVEDSSVEGTSLKMKGMPLTAKITMGGGENRSIVVTGSTVLSCCTGALEMLRAHALLEIVKANKRASMLRLMNVFLDGQGVPYVEVEDEDDDDDEEEPAPIKKAGVPSIQPGDYVEHTGGFGNVFVERVTAVKDGFVHFETPFNFPSGCVNGGPINDFRLITDEEGKDRWIAKLKRYQESVDDEDDDVPLPPPPNKTMAGGFSSRTETKESEEIRKRWKNLANNWSLWSQKRKKGELYSYNQLHEAYTKE